MKKANNRGAAKKPVQKKPATKPSAKPKPRLRKAQGQAELFPILERLAQSAERLAQAAEQLAQAAMRPSATPVPQGPEGAGEVIGVMVVDESQE